ncbi:MAG TPA: hypothetical protein VFB12_10280 [Ktedonobacteraceae bacterium]|nr:hypothetical protein [Ktedonobacteraceae bacterium]
MFTVRQIWFGLIVMVLVVISTAFWSTHMTAMNALPLLGPLIPQGC